MAKKANNFGRFYALLRQKPEADKDSLVLMFTDGRSSHLRDMTLQEYNEMCNALEYGPGGVRTSAADAERRKLRSSALLRIGRLGINTIDNWDGINAFCLSPRIAGKEFRLLTCSELRKLISKLEQIIQKGGIRSLETKDEPAERQTEVLTYPLYIVKPTSKYLS